MSFLSTLGEMRNGSLILPVPHLRQKVLHVDLLALHLHHPGMFEHAPRRGAAGGFFFETGWGCVSEM